VLIKDITKVLFLATIVALLTGCSATKFVPESKTLLDKVTVESDNKSVNPQPLKAYVRQKANSRWFSLMKIPLGTYSLAGRDTSKWINRALQSLGESPIVYDSLQAKQTCEDLRTALQNMGYMQASVDVQKKVRHRKTKLTFLLHPGKTFYVDHIHYVIRDTVIAKILAHGDSAESLLKQGMMFNVDMLDKERKRVTSKLLNLGYYKFHKDFISFVADTVSGSDKVDVTFILSLYRANNNSPERLHPCYTVRNVNFLSDQDRIHLRKKVLEENTIVKAGKLFSADDLQNTYNNFGRLQAVRYTNIQWHELPDTALLDCDIQISTNKPSTLIFQPEGTNTAGDLGAAASLTYQNRNLFRGSELLSLELRGAFEAITGLQGYSDQNYEEYSAETKLSFPRLLVPFFSFESKRMLRTTSELSFMYDLQNRPEFHRRVLSATWRYRWNHLNGKAQYKFDLLDLNYVFMPWISETFRRVYLDSVSSRNAILRYNYENLFIMKIGLGYIYNHGNYSLKVNAETAGNTLHAISSVFGGHKNENSQYTLFNIAYAQYIKGDFDFTKSMTIDYRNSLAMHLGFGIAYPYGNSNILPYEKRYFSGGANSVRGWSVRSLGPGKYSGSNGAIDFINQTGDIKLDMNVEYRTYLFWKLNGAIFVDGGNIWTIRNYEDQPGGQFRFDSFFKQIAFSYGLGLRFNFDYFILRFDFGMKAVNPVYDDSKSHFPIIHPSLSRDLAFHFAVGLPF
jgi:outer membrane protein assembly factor BamA